MIKKTIWVIDDDDIYQILIEKIISNSNLFLNTRTFLSGKEALEVLSSSIVEKALLPDVILLDINMPNMNAWEFMEEFIAVKSRIHKQIEVYIVSSSIANDDKNKSKTYPHVIGYLSKPVSQKELQIIASFG